MLQLLLLAAALAGSALPLVAQGPELLEGRVRDGDARPLRSVTVLLLASPPEDRILSSTETDEAGYFRIRVPAEAEAGARLRFLRIGYRPREETLPVGEPGAPRPPPMEILLEPAVMELEGIRVEAERSRARARFEEEAGVTVRELSGGDIRRLPALAEADPVRAIEVLPGVISPTDFSASFNVRGGSADQNLILLDGFPIFNPFHLGGIFSVFNADMVDRVELRLGGFSAEFGGRVSSVLAVESDPGPGSLSVDGGISLLSARATVSGSLPDGLREGLGLGSARWRASGRRSYVDQLLRPVATVPYALSDLQGIFEGWTPGGSRWVVTGFRGRDALDLGRLEVEDFPLRFFWEWGNTMSGVRWFRGFPGGGSMEGAAGITRFESELLFPDFDDTRFASEVDQLTLRWAGVLRPAEPWRVKGGLGADRYSWENQAEAGGTSFSDERGSGWNPHLFLQGEWSRPGTWILEGGTRLEGWVSPQGRSRWVPSPRLAVKRFLGEETALKASAGRYAQFVHSVRDEELPLGIDTWVTAGEAIPGVVSDQVQVGVERFLPRGWFLSLDAYLRSFDGVITTNLASDPNDPADTYLPGRGTSYGVDLLLEREGEGVTGTLGLSWLKATRTFPDFISGREDRPEITFPPISDRRLDLDLNLRVPLPGAWSSGVRWHLGSGLPFTEPLTSFPFLGPRQTREGRVVWEGVEGAEEDDGPLAVLTGPRNGARYPSYQRLDVSFRRTYTPSWGEVTPFLNILNLYNRSNVLFYFFDFQADPPVRTGLSMFPLLPTLGVEVRF